MTVPAWLVIIGVITGGTALHAGLHHSAHGAINVHQIGLAFFLVLNILITFWEFGLCFTAEQVAEEYELTKETYKGREMDRINEVFKMRIPIWRLLFFSEWTGIWSGYALFDPGYAQKHSFGYNIDVGNGFTTLIPATLFAFGMTYAIVPPRLLGIIGVVMFWQMFFGTVVYFFQFFNSKRHVGHSVGNLILFVGSSNGMWFIFPIWGMAVSVWLIYQDSFAIFM